ncbi:MAG: amidohydrolase family protein, partial [Gemmatimonadota bacterium]|nr:amidohydrolase family protein [Gemmatimonadota bacterium]
MLPLLPRCRTLSILGATAALAAGFLFSTPPLHAQERYDVVLENGRVMDPETGLDAIRNVGIRGRVIEAISEGPLQGDVVIDATGLVVAPGFIDLHAHGQSNRANEFQARDGVTTALEMESGVPDLAGYLGERGQGSVLNYGATVAHRAVRTAVMPDYVRARARVDSLGDGASDADRTVLRELTAGSAYQPLSRDLFPAMRDKLAEGIAAGALGIGMPHQYYPGATYDEILEVFKTAAEF